MIVSDQMQAIEKKIKNRSITSKSNKCFDNSNLKLHMNNLTQESWFQTMMTNYVSVCKLSSRIYCYNCLKFNKHRQT